MKLITLFEAYVKACSRFYDAKSYLQQDNTNPRIATMARRTFSRSLRQTEVFAVAIRKRIAKLEAENAVLRNRNSQLQSSVDYYERMMQGATNHE